MDIAIQAFHSEDTGKDDTVHYDLDDEDDGIEENNTSPKAVGHNIYILAHQVCVITVAMNDGSCHHFYMFLFLQEYYFFSDNERLEYFFFYLAGLAAKKIES